MSGILSYTFMQNAFAAGILVSLACGVIGTLVVLKRMVFISGGVAHTAYGGSDGLLFGINPSSCAHLQPGCLPADGLYPT